MRGVDDRSRPVLLVGATGQVGAALATRLAPLGEVVGVDRSQADLERSEELRALVRRVQPGIVVNAAAYTAVDAAEGDQLRCQRVNAEAPGVLAAEAERIGAMVVHFSTNYVFDGAAPGPYAEGEVTSPINVYGRTKALGERAVVEANPAHLIFRTAGVYGWSGRNFMLRILALAREGEELHVVDDQFVAPTPAIMVADAAVALLARAMAPGGESGLFGTYHLTCSGSTSWFGFAERILALTQSGAKSGGTRIRAVSSETFPAAARRPRNGILNTDKLTRQLGVALPDWETALRATLAERANRSRE